MRGLSDRSFVSYINVWTCCILLQTRTLFRTDNHFMKQIVAVVKPYLVEKILEGLRRAPLEACSVREVKGYGRQKSYLDQYSDTEYSLAFLPKVEINVWVDDARVEETVRKIIEVARTGRMGDGKIYVLPATEYETVVDLKDEG